MTHLGWAALAESGIGTGSRREPATLPDNSLMLIDLNADLGEGAGTDADLMPLVTSANICCGGYAGDIPTMRAALDLAKRHGVRLGAHPGFGRADFGRREITIPPAVLILELRAMLISFFGFAEIHGLTVGYVKPHGALYHQACRDREYAAALLKAIGQPLPVVGLPGSVLEAVATERRIVFIPEGFADRRYRPDGTLVPRTEPDAILHDVKEVVAQVEWLVRTQGVRTICVHGDTPGAVEFVRAVRAALLDAGHELKAFC